jgi:hypothetical protein
VPGFTDTFTSRYIQTGWLRQHAVIGGNGPPLLLVHGWTEPLNNGLWHIAVNRLDEVNEQLVQGREDIYFGYEFNIQAGQNKLPDDLINYYLGLLSNPDSLHGTFVLPRVGRHDGAERAAQEPAAADASACHQRSGQLG